MSEASWLRERAAAMRAAMDVHDLSDAIDVVLDHNAALEKRVAELEAERDEARAKIAELELRTETADARVAALEVDWHEEARQQVEAAEARVAELEVRLLGPRDSKFLVEDVGGERLFFDKIEEARDCADEWVREERREAISHGEWSSRVEFIRIFAEIERATPIDLDDDCGVDFRIKPTPLPDERKDGEG